MVERYGDFLATLNIDFDGPAANLNMDTITAERYVVSLKLQKYMEKLVADKKDYMTQMLAGADVKDKIAAIDADMEKVRAKQEMLVII